MKTVRMFAAAAVLVIGTATIGGAGAQQAPQQDQSGTSGMGPHGMMGSGSMGPGMMGHGGGMGSGMMGSGGSGQAMCSAMTGHIDGRLAFIKAELKITEAQETLWKAYAAAARDNGNTMLAHCTAMLSQPGASTVSLPDRLDRHEQLMAAQLDAVRAMNKALKPLYAALGDNQKQTAEQLFWGHMGKM